METATLADVWIVVPAYNEDQVVRDVVSSLLQHYDNVVVVDDNSNDCTHECLAGLPVHLLRHPINLGQGAALQTGITYALKCGAGVIITFDSDGQHAVEDIPALCRALSDGADVALGSRFLGETIRMPSVRRLVLKAAIWYQWMTSGLKLTDAHCGLRAMTAATARRILIRENRMAHASELIEQFAKLKLEIAEVPVTIAYSEYSLSKGQSSLNAISIFLQLFVHRFRK